MNIVEKKIRDLISAEYNPRQITEKQLLDLKKSVANFGLVEPVVVNINEERYNVVVGGHQRLKIMQELGHTEVPCVEVNLTLERERELNVRLNKNTGAWDWDILANLFEVDELVNWGFTDDELFGAEKIESIEDGDEIEFEQSVQLEPPKEYILIMAEANSVDWEEIKETLQLKMVRRGGYKKGSAFDSVGIERVLWWDEFKKRINANSDTE